MLALLSLTVLLAYQPLGAFNLAVALLIASVKALIVGIVFMELNEYSGLKLAFAGAGFFWLSIVASRYRLPNAAAVSTLHVSVTA